MHRFVEAEAFDVGEFDVGLARGEHLLRVVESLERDVFRLWVRLDLFEKRAEREANPGDYEGPALDTAMAVNALFKRRELHDGVKVESFGFGDFAVENDDPGRGLEVLG